MVVFGGGGGDGVLAAAYSLEGWEEGDFSGNDLSHVA